MGAQPTLDPLQDRGTILTTREGIELIGLPGGSFWMGSDTDEWGRDLDEGPQHEVSVGEFLLGRYAVSNAEYERFLAAHADARRPATLDDPRFNAPRQPVICVNWNEAQRFAAWIGGRLPTEAEWEYACRAGTSTSTYAGDLVDAANSQLDAIAWHRGNSEGKPHPGGEKLPNSWGLYDMLGNVWEWCSDLYEPYPSFPRKGWGCEQVVRGGSWINRAKYARAARRDEAPASFEDERVGFRVAMDVAAWRERLICG